MGVDYKAIITGNINPIDLVRLIKKHYGGDDFSIRFGMGDETKTGHFVISFIENIDDEVKALPIFQRSKYYKHRSMHVFIDGECAGDYAHITTDPMTYVDLGRWGECKEIINSLLDVFGGYVKDEAVSDEWVRFKE